ncbi:MAG: hypothetical protein IK125_07830 [Lachnospiraceae bacterium]|nr:hypothetical protein [Lachnospiraceae bacterium]
MKRKSMKLYSLALSTALLATGCSNPKSSGSTTAAPENTTAAPEATTTGPEATTPGTTAAQATEPATTVTPETDRPVIYDELFTEEVKNTTFPVFCSQNAFYGTDKWNYLRDGYKSSLAVKPGTMLEVTGDVTYLSGGIVGYEHEPQIDRLENETVIDYDTAIQKYKIPAIGESEYSYLHYYKDSNYTYIAARGSDGFLIYRDGLYLDMIPFRDKYAKMPTEGEMQAFISSQAPDHVELNAKELTAGLTDEAYAPGNSVSTEFTDSYKDFAANLSKVMLEASEGNKNFLVSPLSVMTCFTMAANGAAGETLKQMEQALGGDLSIDDIDASLAAYLNYLTKEAPETLSTANSLWLNEGFQMSERIRDDFLKKSINYFDAAVYKTVFDEQALADVNHWVSNKTNKMIPMILDRFAPDSAMLLLNALYFDASWQEPFFTSNTKEATFIAADGKEETALMMGGTAEYYVSGDNYTGFMKEYRNTPFVFAALLPNDGETADDLLKSMSGSDYTALFKNASQEQVSVRLPQFDFDAEFNLTAPMKALGITEAFDVVNADFSGMTGDKSLYIGQAIHKTRIEVTEGGTRAAATTAIDMRLKGVIVQKKVILDRPFVFMILDTAQGLPIFVGTVDHIR